MAESNREPPLCPCGFWGSPQTCGLCSKCYKEMMQKKEHDVSLSSGCQGSTQVAPASPAPPPAVTTPPIQVIVSENSQSSDPSMDSAPSSVASDGATCRPDETSTSSSETGSTTTNDDPDRPVQKNKKRCFKCRCRLELAFVEIGRCKCDYVFCELHRLPEQHDCTYNHKEKGRQEAREKMISPKKHVGTSLKRLDSDA